MGKYEISKEKKSSSLAQAFIILLLLGLFVGYLFFTGKSTTPTENEDYRRLKPITNPTIVPAGIDLPEITIRPPTFTAVPSEAASLPKEKPQSIEKGKTDSANQNDESFSDNSGESIFSLDQFDSSFLESPQYGSSSSLADDLFG